MSQQKSSSDEFEQGFFGEKQLAQGNSADYRLGDITAQGLAAAFEEPLAEPSELEIRRRMAALKKGSLEPVRARQSGAKPDEKIEQSSQADNKLTLGGGSVLRYGLAASVLLVCGVLAFQWQNSGEHCGQLQNLNVVLCGSGSDNYLAEIGQSFQGQSIEQAIRAQPQIKAPIATVQDALRGGGFAACHRTGRSYA